MKQIHQILFFLGCLLAFFVEGADRFDGTTTTHTSPISETYLLEEEREVCDVVQTVQEEVVETSGGNPDTQPAVSFQKSEENQGMPPCLVQIKGFATYHLTYLGKVPLYLRYQSLKLHC